MGEFSIHEWQLISSALRDREHKWYEERKAVTDPSREAYCLIMQKEARDLAVRVEEKWA
jgi:hypothetical protein